ILDYRAPHGIEFISENQVLVTCEADKNLLLVNIDSGNIEKALDTEQEVSHMVCYSPLSQKAFVTNIRSGSVSVMDLKANRLEKIIKTGDGAEGVALSADGKTIWVTNRGEDTVSLVDYQSLEIKKSFRSEKFPIRVKTTSDGKYGLISNAKSGDVRIYDGATHDLVKIIPMEVSAVEKEASRLFQDFDDSPVPFGILLHPNNKLDFVANTNADLITVIDLVKLEIKGRLTAGKEPDGLGFSPIQLN
ncbi:MAG: hypothetical protein KJO25_00700, partial [Bacteroidia bacterium]|nr:hypothetical protein [Bacteroidia bacterium]